AEDAAAHPAARLRVRLADRALRQTNPLLSVLSLLLELATARVTASQVLDLAGTPAVRQRFGFDDDDLERLREWTTAAGVRWGFDADHRRAWHLGGLDQGTWREGLDRLLLGLGGRAWLRSRFDGALGALERHLAETPASMAGPLPRARSQMPREAGIAR
ncbi:MAG: exodeoxyribonuclease V subunit gamma, partial [Actinobacteria bacterium]|nr:exodeoxyribonuclease V subunit gamma [Actinomycetota bacterium]